MWLRKKKKRKNNIEIIKFPNFMDFINEKNLKIFLFKIFGIKWVLQIEIEAKDRITVSLYVGDYAYNQTIFFLENFPLNSTGYEKMKKWVTSYPISEYVNYGSQDV